MVLISLGPFCSGADNAEDFLQEERSLIPMNDFLKIRSFGSFSWSLRLALRYCASVAQGVDISDEIINTTLCGPVS